MPQVHLGLFDTPADRRQIRFSLALAGLLLAALIVILPVRDLRLRHVDAFVPMVDAIMFLGELITATLLYAQAAVFRSRALAALATGFIFSAWLLVPHALTFPGAFAPDGLLGAGVNTTAWLATFRRAALPIAIVLYVVIKRADSARPGAERPEARIAAGVLVATLLAATATLLATSGHGLLPPYFLNRSELIYSNSVAIEFSLFVFFVAATAVQFRNCSSVLDLWLLVALSGWLVQSVLIMALHGRFTVGWYCLYVLMLVSHLIVLLALIAESNRLYLRLALSTAAQDRERESRLMSIDAVAAAISHEVGQPLTAVTTNGLAGLSWLTRVPPDPAMAIKSLRASLDAAHRTTEVIRSIRAMFAKGQALATDFSLNELVRETASLLRRELAGEKVTLELELDETLPPILADRVQMQRVLVNLFTNAIESLGATQGRPRRLTVRSSAPAGNYALLEISDTGIGVAPEEMARMFDAFFTTKATGRGLGLSLCRTIVEDRGGHLWASRGEAHGATLHLQLPCSALPEVINLFGKN